MFVQCSPTRRLEGIEATGPRRIAALATVRVLGRTLTLLAAAFLLSSCIVDEPPDFEDPQRTAPIIDFARSHPSNTTFVPVSSSKALAMSVWIQSEDLRDDLIVIPIINLGRDGESSLPAQAIAPGSFSEPRSAPLIFSFPSTVPTGCVTLTLLFVHRSEVEIITSDGRLHPKEGALVSQGTWVLLVDADPQDVTFADCPQPPTD